MVFPKRSLARLNRRLLTFPTRLPQNVAELRFRIPRENEQQVGELIYARRTIEDLGGCPPGWDRGWAPVHDAGQLDREGHPTARVMSTDHSPDSSARGW